MNFNWNWILLFIPNMVGLCWKTGMKKVVSDVLNLLMADHIMCPYQVSVLAGSLALPSS